MLKSISALLENPLSIVGFDADSGAQFQESAPAVKPKRRTPLSKLVFDKLFSATALVLLAPLMAGVALTIRATGKGPVIFGHTRIGRDGRPFRCLKFRTMRPNSDSDLDALLQIDPIARDEWTDQRKLERDPRVDRVGYILRKTSLDELPQFWNVLRGDMSIVGPRPITASEAEKYGGHFAAYTSVRPGLTGIWQVSGRSDASYDRRVALDVAYIRNWSLAQDISISLRTFRVVLVGRGAC